MSPTLTQTPLKDTFPSTSEQSQQVAVTIKGNDSGDTGLNPAGQAGMQIVSDADSSDEIADVRAETVTPAEIVAAQRTIASGHFNPAGQANIKSTSDSLHGGE